jgi:hypothetical protein
VFFKGSSARSQCGFVKKVAQLVSSTQPSVHVLSDAQIPASPGHCGGPLVTQMTHVLSDLQTGLPRTVHSVVLVPVHWRQTPPTHAGSAEVGHARTAGGLPGAALSLLHGLQDPVDVSQTGLVASHAFV